MAPVEAAELPESSQWTGSVQDDFSLSGRGANNYTLSFSHPWGVPSVSITVAVVYSAWITGANSLLVAVLLTSPKLLNSRQNMLLLHIAIVDLSVGLFYCPLTADYYIRGQWTHGCDSFFVWFIFSYPQVFLSLHLVGLLNLLRVLSSCCTIRVGRWVRNVLFGAALMLLWFYLVNIGAVLDSSRRDKLKIAIGSGRLCRALVASDSAVAVNVLVFFVPAVITVGLLVTNVIREKTVTAIPRTQLQLDSETEQTSRLPLALLSLGTLTSCLTPFPSFVINTTRASGGCAFAECLRWAIPLTTISEWVLFAKAGLVPLVWLQAPDFKMALLGAFHHFRRVPTSDTRDLVDAEVRDEVDDAPFSDM